jgi:hypothetical protein
MKTVAEFVDNVVDVDVTGVDCDADGYDVFVSDVLLVAAGIIVDVTLTHVVDTSYN